MPYKERALLRLKFGRGHGSEPEMTFSTGLRIVPRQRGRYDQATSESQ